jgi:hypothetical protein
MDTYRSFEEKAAKELQKATMVLAAPPTRTCCGEDELDVRHL